MISKFLLAFCFTLFLVMTMSANPTGDVASVRDRRSPILRLLGLKGHHRGHQFGGQYGGNGFSGSLSQAQAFAGSTGGGYGTHGTSGSQSFASSQSQSASFGFGPFTASFSQGQASAGAGTGSRSHSGFGDYF